MTSTLIYVHDPMCSWCWGFRPTHQKLMSLLEDKIAIKRYVGGLAPDSDAPMPDSMQQGLQETWRHIQHTIPGTEFNFDFWIDCNPRRSTYPSNRAVLAARKQGEQFDQVMTGEIQKAYYLQARNPSDNSTHIELAGEIGLDVERFEEDLISDEINQELVEELEFTRSIGLNSFPSMAVIKDGRYYGIPINYNDAQNMYDQIMTVVDA